MTNHPKRQTQQILTVFTIVLALFAGCAPLAGALPMDTPTIAAKIPDLLVHSENTKTPINSPTPLPSATSTPEPAVTALDDPTPTIPLATLAAFATLQALVTENPDLGAYFTWECAVYPCYPQGPVLSPDGSWAAFFSTREGTGGAGLKITHADGTRVWEVYFSEIAHSLCPCEPGQSCPCGEAHIVVEHWSTDGKYLYIAPKTGGEGGDEWFWRRDLLLVRLDLNDGSWTDTHMGSAYAFSPDESRIAYRENCSMQIHDLVTGLVQTYAVPSEFLDFGRIVWSPDSSMLTFVAARERLERGFNQTGLTVFLINLDDRSLKVITSDDLRFIYPVEWADPNEVIFASLYERKMYRLNLNSGEFSVITE